MLLLSLCKRVQNRLLKKEKNMQHDYVIVNLYNLVSQNPLISISQFFKAYKALINTSYETPETKIHLGHGTIFIAQSIALL